MGRGGSITAMYDALRELLGLDLEDITWKDLALCDGTMPTRMFYEDYESDEQVAKVVDEACLSCPVMVQCLQTGIDNDEWGVWGGIYLVSGKPDKNRNAHKTEDVRKQMKERLGANLVHR